MPAPAAEGIDIDGMRWDWDGVAQRRWYVEAEVQLPLFSMLLIRESIL